MEDYKRKECDGMEMIIALLVINAIGAWFGLLDRHKSICKLWERLEALERETTQ